MQIKKRLQKLFKTMINAKKLLMHKKYKFNQL